MGRSPIRDSCVVSSWPLPVPAYWNPGVMLPPQTATVPEMVPSWLMLYEPRLAPRLVRVAVAVKVLASANDPRRKRSLPDLSGAGRQRQAGVNQLQHLHAR